MTEIAAGTTTALLTLLVLWVLRWRGVIEGSLWLRYRTKAEVADNEGDSDWAVRCYRRMHDARSYRRWTDYLPETRPPLALIVTTVAGIAVSIWLVLR